MSQGIVSGLRAVDGTFSSSVHISLMIVGKIVNPIPEAIPQDLAAKVWQTVK